MKECHQTENQSVFEHGISVRDYTFTLISSLREGVNPDGWKLPDWVIKYRENLLKDLFDSSIIEEYTVFHDCGKPFCISYDEQGRRHFPNHAEVSYDLWSKIGTQQAATLIRLDMMVHTIKSDQIEQFAALKEAPTLLIVALAELHSNADMFGGIDSVSFKIKWKHINKKGLKICNKIYGDKI